MCALFVPLQVSPLSATRLGSLVDERQSKDEPNLEFSASSDKEENLINIPLQTDSTSNFQQDNPCSQRLKDDLLNQRKFRKCEIVEAGDGEIVKCYERMALLHCENDARVAHSRSAYIEGPSQTRMTHYEGPSQTRMTRSRSAGSRPNERNCKEKPGRFEMLI